MLYSVRIITTVNWYDVSHQHVINRVRKDFSPEDEAYVLKILSKYGIERHETHPDFIRLAMLRPANGRKEMLELLPATAKGIHVT